MPNSITYNYLYGGVYSAINKTFTVVGPSGGLSPNTVSDLQDGTENGQTAILGYVDLGGASVRVLAWLPEGGVVYRDDGEGADYMLTTSTVSPDQAGTVVTVNGTDPYTFCYLAGTAILTPDGERAVESLAIGDLVATHDGRAVPVRWIGRQVRPAWVARLSGGMPVRIRAGALGVDAAGATVPARDLCVSPDHALLVDGLLIHAGALVNGSSITHVGRGELDEVAYYHIETTAHEIIVADGAPAETFIDNVSREQFDNHAEWLALFPDAPAMTELPLGRVTLARQVPSRVAERLAVIATRLPPTAVAHVA